MRNVISILTGAVAFFVWGAVAWMVLPWHANAMRPVPNERFVADTLSVVLKEPGMYQFPSEKNDAPGQPGFMERAQKGPVGLLVFLPHGKTPMAPGAFLIQFLSDVLVSAALFFILSLSSGVSSRVAGGAGVAALVAVVAWLSVDVMNWNWLSFPAGYTLIALFDKVVGFSMVGAVHSMIAFCRGQGGRS